jgi:hypothetical protein
VRVICIAIGNSADVNLERLAKETNGNTYIASDNNREMAVRVIESAFQEVKISKELSESITIEVSKDLISIVEQTLNKTIIIDSDIGRNTNFTIGSEDFDKFSVSLTSPKGQKYDSTSSEYVKNQSLKRYQFKLKSAEPGIWTISFVKTKIRRKSKFQRQHIVGCFRVTQYMPSTPKDPKRLEQISKTESLSSKSISSKFISQSVEALAPKKCKGAHR